MTYKTFTKTQKAEQSQKIVCDYLIKHGFVLSEVVHPNANGIDIVAIKSGKRFLIEVKSVIYSSRSYKVKSINKQSDYVAIVMPNQVIHFDTADNRNKGCDKVGGKSITKLVNLYLSLNDTNE